MPSNGLGIVNSSLKLPTLSGGSLTSDAKYFYRVFNSSGTLVVKGGPVTVDLLIGSGGGGGSQHTDLAPASPWYAIVYVNDENGGYYTLITRYIYAAIGGAAGGVFRKFFNVPLTPQFGENHTVTVGAGGAANAAGGFSRFATPTNYWFHTETISGGGTGVRNGRGTGGSNLDNSGGIGSGPIVDYSLGIYPPYIPTYYDGGGGAGYVAFPDPNSNTAIGGTPSLEIPEFKDSNGTIRDYGAGSSGISGTFEGGDDYRFFRNWQTNRTTDGQYYGAGTSVPSGTATNAVANRGGGGGSSPNTAGNGGSGLVIVRYLRSAVKVG